MKSSTLHRGVLVGLALFAGVAVNLASRADGKSRNANPGVAPINSHVGGKTYGEWVAAWWTWAISIPADRNPIFDTTGEFGLTGQTGKVYFLAGNFGGTVERSLTVPSGTRLFFPLYNSVWWAPDDLDDAAFVAGLLGLNPALMSDEELIALIASFSISEFSNMTLTIDGEPVHDLESYRAASDPFPLPDTDLIDTTGGEISQPNFAIGDGYWVMLNPLKPGEHTIRFTVTEEGPIFDPDEPLHDVTYHLTVTRGK